MAAAVRSGTERRHAMARADLATTAVKHGASSVIAVACGHCGIFPVAAVREATHSLVSQCCGRRALLWR